MICSVQAAADDVIGLGAVLELRVASQPFDLFSWGNSLRNHPAPSASGGTIGTRVDKQINAPVCCIVAFVDRRQSHSAPV